MNSLLQFLADQPLMTAFLIIGIGMALGHIKIKGVGLGAAAVLFLAIAVAALGQANGIVIEIPHLIGTMGLVLFAFAIGNNAGGTFFQSLRQATGPIVTMVVLFILAAVAAYFVGVYVFDMDTALIAGTFAGALTNTPALAAAGESSGDPGTATVGYAVAYLFGVIGMIIAANAALRKSAGDTDTPSPVRHENVRVDRDDMPTVGEVMAEASTPIEFSRIRRGEEGPIWIPDASEKLHKGDLVTLVGEDATVDEVTNLVGHPSSHSLRSDRRLLDFRRITVSEPKMVGKTIGELDAVLAERWGAKISRVRRGDQDMLAIPNIMVEMGDRVRVVGPTTKLKEISSWLGDSSKGLTDINPIALGLGLGLGIMLGSIKIPVPGGGDFSLGAAAGVLIVGIVMGRLGRVGNVVTALPKTANLVISELGLLVFLAQAGTNAGGQIGEAFTSGAWWQILILGVIITMIMAAGLYFAMRGIFKMGGTKLSGVLAGSQTQPAVLAFANGRSGSDPRVALGYALVYPVAMVTKILVAHVLGGL